jgi:capsular polysaccharide biosynthesis protein
MSSRLVPWLAVLTLTAAGAAAAAGYGLTAPKRYRATATLIVAPISPSDETFAGIAVLRDTGGKRTAAADVAALLRTPQIVDAVAAQLALKRSRQSLSDAIDARVVDSSDVVAVTAEDTSRRGAAELANTFANALVTQRSGVFQAQLANAIRRDERVLAALSRAQRRAPEGAAVTRRLITLRGFQGQSDPTVELAAQAVPPTASAWPHLPLLLGIGAGCGAALGALIAMALLALRRRMRVGSGRYDRLTSDQALENLVDRLEARLIARESALAARERDLQAALDELRSAQSERSAEAIDRGPIGEQEQELTGREEELAERMAAVSARERELTGREEELAEGIVEVSARERELTGREEELAERIVAITARERELARQAAGLAVRERELDARSEPEPAPEPEPAAEPKPAPAPERVQEGGPAAADARPSAPPSGNGYYNLLALERLVAQKGGQFPDRLDEWSSYLFFLRDHASPDGSIAASFDWLIEETFADLFA